MPFVQEVHKVTGKRAADFEDAYRTGWLPTLAKGSDARLLWYFDLAHELRGQWESKLLQTAVWSPLP